MAENTKPNQIRIRIEDTDLPILDDLAGTVLSRTDVASVLLHAAVAAVRKNRGKIHLPLVFRVEEGK